MLSMAGTLLHLLTHHSAFMPILLAGDEAADQLPPQAAQMQVPITSLLPLVEAQPHESQVGDPLDMLFAFSSLLRSLVTCTSSRSLQL